MLNTTSKILILFLVSSVLASPIADEVKDKDVKEVLTPVYHAHVAVPAEDEGISIPVQVIHEVGRSIDNDIQTNKITDREEALVEKLNTKCSQREISSCVMLKLVSYMNRLLKKANIEVYDGLEITQTTAVVEEVKVDGARADEDEETQFTQLISDKFWNFARSRSIRWNILGDSDLVFSTVADEQGALKLGVDVSPTQTEGRGKKHHQLGPIIAAGAMKFGLLGALAFKGLVLLVGKAVLVSKIALLLAAILGLSKLFHHEKHVTYEVVAHPHHSSSHGHSEHGGESHSSGWGRSLPVQEKAGDAQNIAYSAHAPK